MCGMGQESATQITRMASCQGPAKTQTPIDLCRMDLFEWTCPKTFRYCKRCEAYQAALLGERISSSVCNSHDEGPLGQGMLLLLKMIIPLE
jgi:hypothetical protein